MTDPALEVCALDPAPAPEITVDEARARVKEFAGVPPVIVRTESWLPGQDTPKVTWRVRIYAARPKDLEVGGLTLTGAVEQLRVAVADTPGWRKT